MSCGADVEAVEGEGNGNVDASVAVWSAGQQRSCGSRGGVVVELGVHPMMATTTTRCSIPTTDTTLHVSSHTTVLLAVYGIYKYTYCLW